MENIHIDMDTRSVYAGKVIVGSFSVRTDTTYGVYDYRDDTGFIGTMTYEQVINYFEGYETE